jgi:two-component system phosphate regulon response regulator OmpR
LSVDFTKRSVSLKGKHIDLTNAEFEILSLFIKNAGKVLNRDQILDEARGIEWDSFNRSVDVLISRLRQKLYDNPKNPDYLKTVWGTGYMFIGEEIDDE